MTRFEFTSLTWKYVPLSGKLPLIAVRHGICNKLGFQWKKAMLAYIVLLQVVTLKDNECLGHSPVVCLLRFVCLPLLCHCTNSMSSHCTGFLIHYDHTLFQEVELNSQSHLVAVGTEVKTT